MANQNLTQNATTSKARFEDRWNVALLCKPIVERAAQELGLDLSNLAISDALADAVEGGFFAAVKEVETLFEAFYYLPDNDGFVTEDSYPTKYRGCNNGS